MRRIRLKDLVRVVKDKSLPESRPELPYVGLEHIEAHTTRLLGQARASEMRSAAFEFKAGDVLYSRLRPNLNKVWFAEFDGLCSSEFIVLRAHEWLDPTFLRSCLNSSAFAEFAVSSTSGDRPRVKFDAIAEYSFEVPDSIHEQRRIAAQIDVQLSRLYAGLSSLSTARERVLSYRSSVLVSASTGRLLHIDQGVNNATPGSIETASDLLKSIVVGRQNALEDLIELAVSDSVGGVPGEELPNGWIWTTVGQIASVGTGSTPSRKNHLYFEGGRIPWVTSSALNESAVSEASEFITARAVEECRMKVYPAGTILVAMYGDGKTRGKSAELRIAAAVNQAIAAIEVPEAIQPYLKMYFAAKYEDIRRAAIGAVQKNLNLGIIKRLPVALPPARELGRIMQEVDRLLSFANVLEAQINNQLRRGSSLHQAVLAHWIHGHAPTPASVMGSLDSGLKDESLNSQEPRGGTGSIESPSERSPAAEKAKFGLRLISLDLPKRFYSLEAGKFHFRNPGETSKTISPVCLVGVNGSGKSNLLEVLSQIFVYLDLSLMDWQKVSAKARNIPVHFELEYEFVGAENEPPKRVKISRKSRGSASFEVEQNGISTVVSDSLGKRNLLPRRVIGYSSGLNETISLPYAKANALYSRVVRNQADFEIESDARLPSVTESHTLFLDYDLNSLIVVSNYLLGNEEKLAVLQKGLRLEALRSFEIRYRPVYELNKRVRLTRDLQDAIDLFRRVADSVESGEAEAEEVFVYSDVPKLRESLATAYGSASELFGVLYRLSLLNALALTRSERDFFLREEAREEALDRPPTVTQENRIFGLEHIRLKLLGISTVVDYNSISDGEHQFLQVLGSVLLFDEPGSLFLLDEPETHFNPLWRRRFVEYLDELPSTRKQEFILSTHSPFVVSGCKGQHVLQFVNERGKSRCRHIDFETFGASYDYILGRLFNMHSMIADVALDEMRRVVDSGDTSQLEEAVTEFGESLEKRFVYEKLAELNSEREEAKG